MAKRQPRQGIPTNLSVAQFEQFVLPHLSKGRRGPATKLGWHSIFNYILRLLYLGCLQAPPRFCKLGLVIHVFDSYIGREDYNNNGWRRDRLHASKVIGPSELLLRDGGLLTS
jgi:hypothetical protein